MADTTAGDPFPWPAASATGIGSMPGTDPAEAMRLIFGELPDLPHLAELPARGPGADLTGRTAGLLIGLPVETTPRGWRFTGRPGRDLARARGALSSDLDTLAEAAQGYTGPLKVQVCGPWTLAATIELTHSQEPALTDPGAVADLTESLAEGVRAHLDEVGKRVPGATVLLQVDEPALPAVIAGTVPTASGLSRLPAPDATEAEARLRAVISAGTAFTIVHCCGRDVPFAVIEAAGADAVSFDMSRLRPEAEESLAEVAEAGLGILAGVVPAAAPETGVAAAEAARGAAERVIRVWRRMGWPTARAGGGPAGPAGIASQVVLTPACGLAGASPGYARSALARCRQAARLLPELIEESRW